MTRYVIIGAGEAGARAALDLKDKGQVTLIGAEPHLPYERPPLSKPEGEDVVLKPICAASAMDHVTYLQGVSVTAIDRQNNVVRLSDGTDVAYDKLLLATGSTPRALPCEGGEHALPMRTFEDAKTIFDRAASANRVVVIGAGLIGLELAAVLRTKGVEVTVLEAGPRALGRALAPTLADHIVARHQAEGVDLRFDVRISHLTENAVHLTSGSAIEAEVIVAAIGVIPNTQLAEDAGLTCANGIVVGPDLQTKDPSIFAAGDCASLDHPEFGQTRFEAWRVAVEMGAAAAKAMAGEEVTFAPTPWFWSDQYDLGLQMAGFHNPQNRCVTRQAGDSYLEFELDAKGRLVAAAGIATGNTIAKDIKLAERMINARQCPDPERLADPADPLKKLMRDAVAL